jgi:hypothetical protein
VFSAAIVWNLHSADQPNHWWVGVFFHYLRNRHIVLLLVGSKLKCLDFCVAIKWLDFRKHIVFR